MYEFIGNCVLALSCLLALSIPFLVVVEIYDEIVQAWRDRRRQRDGDDSDPQLDPASR